MNSKSIRGFKIADHLRKTVSEVIRSKVRDPRLKRISITDVEVTYDISIAKIYYSVYPWSQDNLDMAYMGLKSAKKFIRMQLGKELTCYKIPEITFHLDDSLHQGSRINELISSIVK